MTNQTTTWHYFFSIVPLLFVLFAGCEMADDRVAASLCEEDTDGVTGNMADGIDRGESGTVVRYRGGTAGAPRYGSEKYAVVENGGIPGDARVVLVEMGGNDRTVVLPPVESFAQGESIIITREVGFPANSLSVVRNAADNVYIEGQAVQIDLVEDDVLELVRIGDLWRVNNAGLTIDGGPGVVFSAINQQVARGQAGSSVDFTLANGTNDIIDANFIDQSPPGSEKWLSFDPTTGLFTVLSGGQGVYRISVSVSIENPGGGAGDTLVVLNIEKNGGSIQGGTKTILAPDGDQDMIVVEVHDRLLASDTIGLVSNVLVGTVEAADLTLLMERL